MNLQMSEKERDRLKLLPYVLRRDMTAVRAAELLRPTIPQKRQAGVLQIYNLGEAIMFKKLIQRNVLALFIFQ